MDRQRLVYIDILRAFAIMLVVMGHLLKHTGTDNMTLSGVIYSFHMPLFMGISGFVAAYSACFEYEEISWFQRWKNTGKYIKKKFMHIMLPFLAWPCIVYPFFFSTRFSLPDYASIFRHMFVINDSFWFLPCLFFLSICFALYRLGRSWCKRDNIFINLLLLGSIFIVLSAAFALSKWENLRSVLSYFIPFFIGVLMGQYPAFYRHLSTKESMYTAGLLTLALVSGIYFRDSEALCGKIARMLCGCASIPLCFYWFRNRAWNPYLSAGLSYIGRNTLTIYILHFAWLPEWDLSVYHFPLSVKLVIYPLLCLVVIVPILGVNLILEQSTLTRRLLLGRQ